jgi:transcriptional regulator with XRE-family HTH domain
LTTLGDHLRKARLDRGLRQDEVARELGVGYQTVSNWERNYSRVGPRLLPKVVAFLGYDPRENFLPGGPGRDAREEGPPLLREIS